MVAIRNRGTSRDISQYPVRIKKKQRSFLAVFDLNKRNTKLQLSELFVCAMLKQATTLLKKEHLWIFNKQCKQHFNELLKGQTEENKWKPVHRLDYETSGAICYAREDVADQFTKLFKERGTKKLYFAGASQKIPGRPLLLDNFYF